MTHLIFTATHHLQHTDYGFASFLVCITVKWAILHFRSSKVFFKVSNHVVDVLGPMDRRMVLGLIPCLQVHLS